MDYPHGHTHHRRDEREEEYPPPPHVGPPFDPYHNQPPPPPYVRPAAFDPYNQPPPPVATHVHHSSHGAERYPNYPPQPNTDYYNPPPPVIDHHRPPTHDFHYSPETPAYPPPPRADPYPSGSNVHHVSHEENKPHHFSPSSFIHSHTHHQGPDVLNQKPTVRLYSKAETNYSLTIRDGKVILAPSNPSDPFQHWIKDEKFSTKVKDEQGYPSFALVNKATGQAMKHSIGATHPVQLIHYNPDKLDESVLWTLSKDLGDGYRTIRMVNNIRLNVDAFNGDANHGGVRDGTTIVLWEWKKGENQRWKIIPYCKSLNHINSVIEFPGKGFLRVQCVLVAIFGNAIFIELEKSCLDILSNRKRAWVHATGFNCLVNQNLTVMILICHKFINN